MLMIACFDWLLYATTMLTQPVPLMVVVCSMIAGVVTGVFELRANGVSFSVAFAIGAYTALLVALPLPVLGSALIALALLWRLGTSLTTVRTQAR
jgi:hypothetical protein